MSDNLFTQISDDNGSKFAAIFTNNSEAIALSHNGILLLCNQSFLTTFGYSSEEEIIGQSVLTLIAPEAQENIKEYIAKRSKNEAIPIYFETIGIRKDGTKFDFEISSSNYTYLGEVHSVVIGRNITEKKKIQKELMLSEEKFRIAFQSSPSIVGISTLNNGTYLEINDQFTKVLGWTREEAVGQLSSNLRIFKDYSKRQEIIKEVSEKGNIRNFEIDILTKTGSTITIEFNADLIDFQDQKCLLAQLHDISDRKLAETTLKRLNEELETRVKNRTKELEESMHELEAFSYSISHDLKAPLRAINAYCQLFMEENFSTLTDISKHRLQKVKESSLYMNQLIDDLLNLYKVKNSVVKWKRNDASRMVETILETLKTSDPDRTMDLQIQNDVSIWGDEKLIHNILENLLDNAWKFTVPRRVGKIEFGSFDQNGEQVYFVRDNGIGFNMEFVNKLFGAFHKLHSIGEYPGTGIGLATIQRIIHLHHGKIWAESELEKGATFYFTIPRQT